MSKKAKSVSLGRGKVFLNHIQCVEWVNKDTLRVHFGGAPKLVNIESGASGVWDACGSHKSFAPIGDDSEARALINTDHIRWMDGSGARLMIHMDRLIKDEWPIEMCRALLS